MYVRFTHNRGKRSGDGNRNAASATSRGNCVGMILTFSNNHDVLACIDCVSNQLRLFADKRRNFVFKHANVHRRASGHTAAGDVHRSVGQHDNLKHVALRTDFDHAALRRQLRLFADGRKRLGIADQHADRSGDSVSG